MPVVIVDELERATVGTQCVAGLGAIGEDRRVVEHGGQ
jgi:hypothetical protein